MRALGFGDPFGPFVAQTLPDKLALLACVLLLFGVWWGVGQAGPSRARIAFALCGALFVGSLAARSLTLPFVVLSLGWVARASVRRSEGWRRSALFAGIGAIVLATSLGLGSMPTAIVAEMSPAEETRSALEEGNLFEARLWGERWAAETSGDPGEAALLLGQINWGLGHRARARAIAATIAARASDADIRRRAGEDLAQWKDAK